MGGYNGCNSFGGNYKTEGDKISIIKTRTTLKRCPWNESGGTLSGFSVGNVNRFEIKAGKLNLYQDDKLLLTFEAQKNS